MRFQIRAFSAPLLPAGAIKRIYAVSGHGPGIVQSPDRRFLPGDAGQSPQAQITRMDDVQMQQFRFLVSGHPRQPKRIQVENRLQRQYPFQLANCPVNQPLQ